MTLPIHLLRERPSMRLKFWYWTGLVALLLLTWQKAEAQLAPADDFFNGGAQLYISNNIPAALERVEMGLKNYPNDEKLKKLEQLLKQQQQQNQQNQQNQQQSQNNQKQQDQKNQQQNQQQQNQQDQQKRSDQQKQEEQKQNPADQKKGEDQKQQDEKKDSDDKSKDEQEEQQGQPVKPGEMTPEQAKRLLDAQKDKEQLLQFKPDGKPRNPNRPIKDW